MRSQVTEGQRLALLPAVTITAAVAATGGTVFPGLAGVKYILVQAKFTYGSGGTTAKAYLQTSLDGGTTWIDIASFSFTTASATKVSALSLGVALAAASVPADGALANDTILNGLIGDRFRVKYVTTGTYGGSTTLEVTAVAKG